MTEYITLTVKDPTASRNNAGIYLLDYSLPETLFKTTSDRPNIHFSQGNGKNVYAIQSLGKKLFFITRSHFYSSLMDNNKLKTSCSLWNTLFPAPAEKSHRDNFDSLFDNEQFCGSMSQQDNRLFVAVYAGDKLKLNPSINLKLQEGFLFCSESNNDHLPNFKLLEQGIEDFPTGQVISIDDLLIYPSYEKLVSYNLDSLTSEILLRINNSDLRDDIENIICFDHKKFAEYNLSICCGAHGSYSLSCNGKEINSIKKRHYLDLKDNPQRFYLPSEATSVLLVDYNNQFYTLFGCDAGKLLIYELDINNNKPKLTYHKTIDFLALDDFSYGNKDDYLWNIRSLPNADVCFTLRNIFIRISFQNLLNYNPQQRIQQLNNFNLEKPRKEIETEINSYLKDLKDKYSLGAAYLLPYRITDWHIWSV
ncbi:hypothetical protein HYX11_04615 [Candidatus Woesearchaeota archaeon]|nr:hypothetical protein [Candidatus Woesearchaeota archaeon]